MPMKFRAHDTFFIRKGWLSKGMRCVASKPDVFIAHDENPMDVLGIGANMVKALRYWLQTVGLTEEPNKGKRTQSFTDLGKLIYKHDTYIEELGTLYLLQYYLASQKEEATAWYFFFNEFSMSEFSREDFVTALQKYIKMEDTETEYAIRSLNDDFQCIINTYLPRYKSNPDRVNPENNIDCPFGELGLVDIINKRKKTYKGRFEEARLNLLSNLIAAGRLEIKIAFLEDDNTIGMFHEKLGLMYDEEDNIIAFSGSMNESANAFTTNYEAIDVFASWTQDADRVFIKQAAFNAMWEDYEPSIKVMDFPDVNEEILRRYRKNDCIDTRLDEDSSEGDAIPVDEPVASIGPIIPAHVHMREYQIEAIQEWAKRNYVGIFDMATGTGKTYTALAAVSRLYMDMHQNLAVIIICPYQHLVEQWKEDIVAFGMKPIVCYSSSSQRNWRERLKTAVTSFNLGVQDHFCMVSTNATFSIEYVQDLMAKLVFVIWECSLRKEKAERTRKELMLLLRETGPKV